MKLYTIDDVMKLELLPPFKRDEIERLFSGRSHMSFLDIMQDHGITQNKKTSLAMCEGVLKDGIVKDWICRIDKQAEKHMIKLVEAGKSLRASAYIAALSYAGVSAFKKAGIERIRALIESFVNSSPSSWANRIKTGADEIEVKQEGVRRGDLLKQEYKRLFDILLDLVRNEGCS